MDNRDLEVENQRERASYYQLRLRHFVWIVAGSAVLTLLVRRIVGGTSRRDLAVAAIEMVIVFGSASLTAVVLLARRARVDQLAGKILMTITHPTERPIAASVLTVSAPILVAAGYSFVVDWLEHESFVSLLYLSGIVCVLTFSCIVHIWWNTGYGSLEVRECGVIIGGLKFVSWDRIQRAAIKKRRYWTLAPARRFRTRVQKGTLRVWVEPCDVWLLRKYLAQHGPVTVDE